MTTHVDFTTPGFVRPRSRLDDVQRVYARDLQGLDPFGRPCERCGAGMHDHEWADLDPDGFVVRCSKAESL